MQTRREFLYRTGLVTTGSALGLANTGCIDVEQMFPGSRAVDNTLQASAGNSPLVNASAPGKVVHTLNRISFGISDSDLARANTMGLEAYIEEQLNPESIQDAAVESVIAQKYPKTRMSGQTLEKAEKKWTAEQELRDATLYRMFYSNRQLQEVMVDFWSNHFSIDGRVNRLRWYKTIDDRNVVRKHALGNFRSLLHASAKSPAMLDYLNNASNTRQGPNENYARELMELHTLGINGGYTEKDIREVARCFTGWQIDRPVIGFRFVTGKHDQGEKQVLDSFIPAGGGVEDGERVLDMLASHPVTARFIAGKLVRRFVADEPPATLVERVAEEFLATGGDIRAMLRVILHADEFLNATDAKMKRPLEFVASVVRTLMPDPDTYTGPDILATLKQLGQVPFSWPAPNGYPDTAKYWNSVQGLATRWEYALSVSERVWSGGNSLPASWLTDVKTPEELVHRLADKILHRPVQGSEKTELLQAATGGVIAPDSPIPDRLQQEKAILITAALLASPYFMVR